MHDVASILKEFFKDLPEPLLPREVYHPLLAIQSKITFHFMIVSTRDFPLVIELCLTQELSTHFISVHPYICSVVVVVCRKAGSHNRNIFSVKNKLTAEQNY